MRTARDLTSSLVFALAFSQYTVAVQELVFTTISGVVAVNIIGFLMIPHWTAILFVFPIIIMLYFLLLGELTFPESLPAFFISVTHPNLPLLLRPIQERFRFAVFSSMLSPMSPLS